MHREAIFPDWGQQNILNLSPDLQEFANCHVVSHTRHHSVLTVKMVFYRSGQSVKALQLLFISPIYYEGGLQWLGGNLSVGSKDEVVEYYQLIGSSKDDAMRAANAGVLFFKFTVTTPIPRFVRVLAVRVVVTYQE